MRMTIADGVAELGAEAWDELVCCASPFVNHAFLSAIERSRSVGPGTGWTPLVLLAHQGERLVGASPAYVKTHSYGEYIFDWAWAEAAQRNGIPYFPKLVVMPPFTPVTGRRLLSSPDAGPEVAKALAEAARQVALDLGLSSVHWLFVTEGERDVLVEAGYQPRLTHQYHWTDQGFGSWEGFLSALSSKRRREIRREQRRLGEGGIAVRMLRGEELEANHWEALDRFYRSTSLRKWGKPYLSPEFFRELQGPLASSVRMAAATREGRLIAGGLYFEGSGGLYGRYWGCDEHHRYLHFETAYHTGIRYCLEQGLPRFEAGAQGEHKIARGFAPVAIHSAHWLAHPGLADAVARFLEAEAEHTRSLIEVLGGHSPYQRDRAAGFGAESES